MKTSTTLPILIITALSSSSLASSPASVELVSASPQSAPVSPVLSKVESTNVSSSSPLPVIFSPAPMVNGRSNYENGLGSSAGGPVDSSPSENTPTESPMELVEEETQDLRMEWGDLTSQSIGPATSPSSSSSSSSSSASSSSSSPSPSIISSAMTQADWKVPLISQLVSANLPLVLSPKFYTLGEGTIVAEGFHLQMILIPNSTYSDNTSHLGIFFRLVTGQYDSKLIWPYQFKTVISVVPMEPSPGLEEISMTILPNRDSCRLRSAFLRPSIDSDNNPRPDGCGSRRIIDLTQLGLFANGSVSTSPYVVNNTLHIRMKVFEGDTGESYASATLGLKFNEFISEYVWNVNEFERTQQESFLTKRVAVLSSEPFYTHSSGYLFQLFLTLLPSKHAFAISAALLQGDFDRNLDWPFPYPFEVAIIDQSPNYWRRDYSLNLDASSADCGSSPFLQPTSSVEFCFITVQSMELLSLAHYNFIQNGTLKIRFMSKIAPLARKPMASLTSSDGFLVAEYSWLIPDIENKLERFDYSGRKVKSFASHKFYTGPQGYLMQMLLQLNHTDKKNGSMGLELAIVEGEYDSLLTWPFSYKYELMIINQRPDDYNGHKDHNEPSNGDHNNAHHHLEPLDGPTPGDIVVTIDPSRRGDHRCDPRSFTKPIERNPSCGKKNLISFARVSRSTGFVRLGNLLVKTRVYLKNLLV